MSDLNARIPEPIRLVRDFVNSVELQVGADEFENTDRLAAWLAQHDLLSPGDPLAAADLDRAIAVREGLRSVLHLHAGHETDSGAIDRMNATLAACEVRLGFDHSGATRVDVTGGGRMRLALDSLVKAIALSASDGTWERLKVCARESCQWAFYDESRNRSGRWCSMAGCGNYIKMRRVAERHAKRAPGDDRLGAAR